jgi:hypothetical protein
MGITQHSYDLLLRYRATQPGLKMLELGDQNLYFSPYYGEYAKKHFIEAGIEHISVDIQAFEGGSVKMDLSKPFNKPEWVNYFDVVTDFGTSEHVSGSLYHCFKNIHECSKFGGLMIHENPKTGNWPGHGAHYFTREFYYGLRDSMGYELLESGQHPAMGNETDGWNIWAVLRKTEDKEFISEKEFNKLKFLKQ